MEHEDGVNAGTRNIGRFFLAAIPWVLGTAAAVWLSTYIALHEFRHELSQEDRAATYVGATERPKSKIKISVSEQDCSHITRADLDGSTLLIYAKNDCHETLDYLAWHWQTIAPNGTALKEGYTNSCPLPAAGATAECRLSISSYGEDLDDRVATVRVWTRIDTR
jgi:hypothetical protein